MAAFLTELRAWPLPGLWGVLGTLWAPLPPSQLDTHPLTPCLPSSSNICQHTPEDPQQPPPPQSASPSLTSTVPSLGGSVWDRKTRIGGGGGGQKRLTEG